MEKLNKNTVAECYTIEGTDIAQGYADYLRDKQSLKQKVKDIEKREKKQRCIRMKSPKMLLQARKINEDKKKICDLEKEVQDQFSSTFYIWQNFNSYLFWDLLFSNDVVNKMLKTFSKLKKPQAEKIYKNMLVFKEWLLSNVLDRKKLEAEIQYRQQDFFQDMHNAMEALHISHSKKQINWNVCLHHSLKVLTQADEYETALKIYKYFVFVVKNFRAISLYLQKRIKPAKQLKKFSTSGFKWLPKKSKRDVHFILDQFLENDNSFYVVSRNDAKTISRFQDIEGAFKHSKHEKLFIKYRIVLNACEIMLKNDWIACTVKYSRRNETFTIKHRTKSFDCKHEGKYNIKVVDEMNKPIGEITFGPNDTKYKLVKVDIEPNYSKAEDIMFAIGFSILYLLKKNVHAKNFSFPYLYFPKWSEIKE